MIVAKARWTSRNASRVQGWYLMLSSRRGSELPKSPNRNDGASFRIRWPYCQLTAVLVDDWASMRWRRKWDWKCGQVTLRRPSPAINTTDNLSSSIRQMTTTLYRRRAEPTTETNFRSGTRSITVIIRSYGRICGTVRFDEHITDEERNSGDCLTATDDIDEDALRVDSPPPMRSRILAFG
jgi:hypothetical protein